MRQILSSWPVLHVEARVIIISYVSRVIIRSKVMEDISDGGWIKETVDRRQNNQDSETSVRGEKETGLTF